MLPRRIVKQNWPKMRLGCGNAKVNEYEFPFPEPKRPSAPIPGGGEDDVFWHTRTTAGFARPPAVTRCLNAGLTERPQYTLD